MKSFNILVEVRKLISGQFSHVYLGQDMKEKKPIVLKILRPGINNLARKIYWKKEVILTKLLQEVQGVIHVYDIVRNPSSGIYSIVSGSIKFQYFYS